MSKQRHRSADSTDSGKKPEPRYSYYRRCQVFRKNGEQCKAPAEKGSQICHAHAGQEAMEFRRDLERRIVLAEAVAEMRGKGRPEFEMADLFMDFNGIQVTLAVMGRALIDGRIDCKTAGRLVVQLQTMSKLLWMNQRTKTLPLMNADNTDWKKTAEDLSLTAETWRRKENRVSPQIHGSQGKPGHAPGLVCADERGLNRQKGRPEANKRDRTTKDTLSTLLSRDQGCSGQATEQEKISELSARSAKTRNEKIVAIRSAEGAPSPSCTFWRRGSRPSLLTG